MAKGKKSFTAYCDWKETFNSLPDDKAGQLIKHLFAYVNDENPETDDILINAVFAQMKATLKRDLKKWEAKREQNKENALKRWNKNDAVACGRIKHHANNAVSDSVSVSDINKINKYPEDVFLENWAIMRKEVLNQPTNINKLTSTERASLNNALKDYTKEEINEALYGLFNQKNLSVRSIVLRPTHFLENIPKYYQAQTSKEYELYGKERKE